MSSKAAQAEKDRQEYLEYLDFLEAQGADKAEVQRKREAATPGLFMQGLDKAVRVLDYAGGLVRGAGAGAIELATGREDLVDVEDVLKGQAPGAAEIAEKLGVPQGGRLSDVLPGLYSETGEGLPLEKGGMLDITPRGAAGFAGDVALDPLTYLSLGAVPAAKYGAKLAKATTPITQAAKKVGTPLYKSGLKAIDELVAKYGKEPVSDVLMKYGVSGSAQDIAKQMDELGEKLLQERTGILTKATEKGGTASMSKAMAPAESYIAQIRASRDPSLQPIADALEEQIIKYKQLDPKITEASMGLTQGKPVTPLEATQMKTSLYQSMPKSAYAEAVTTTPGKKGQKLMAQGLKEETEGATMRTLGEQEAERLAQLNDELGRVLTSKDKAAMEARKELMKNTVTSVDAPLMAYDFQMALLKKAADISKLTGTRTRGGKALKELGESRFVGPGLDIGARQSLIDYLQGE